MQPYEFIIEAWKLLRLASSIALTVCAAALIALIETLVASALGTEQLAGVGLGVTLFNLVFVAGLGVVVSLTPLVARRVGSGEIDAGKQTAQHGIVVTLGLSCIGLIIFAFVGPILTAFGADARTISHAKWYIAGAALALPGQMIYIAVRSIVVALDETYITTVAMVASIPLYIVFAIALSGGRYAIFPLGVFGIGLAYSLTSTIMAVSIFLLGRKSNTIDLPSFLAIPASLEWSRMKEILQLGIPMAARIMLLEGALPAATGLVAYLGADALVVHNIAIRLISLGSIVAFGISNAATARISHALGAGDRRLAKSITLTASAVSVVSGLLVVAVIYANLDDIVAAFGIAYEGGAAVTAQGVLAISCIFLLAETVQGPFIGSLVAFNDTRSPLIIVFVGLWLFGTVISATLTHLLNLGITGAWLGFAIANSLTALMFMWASLRHFYIGRIASGALETRA